MGGIVITAPASGGGKTTVSCALMAALKKRGMRVSAFKCGPDYIDPMFHERALGIPSANLDAFFCGEELLKGLYARHSLDSDITVVEGVMGYYDGVDFSDTYASTYHIAKTLALPAAAVINARGAALSAAAVIKGMADFRQDSNIKAVIFNNISEGTYSRLKPAVENELDISVCGFLPHTEECIFSGRHLGLADAESEAVLKKIDRLALLAEKYIDIDKITAIANECPKNSTAMPRHKKAADVTIAVARDKAFCFYYKDNIELLEDMGCVISYFSPIADSALPPADGLILGGGYPELYARELSENKPMLLDIRRALEGGMPCLAECGGFMYLHRRMQGKDGSFYDMAGLINADALYTDKLVRFGYIELSEDKSCLLDKDETLKAHEFHYWDSTDNGALFKAKKPSGREWRCIHLYKNTLCGFPHIYYYSNPDFARRFVLKCSDCKGGILC